MLFSLRDFDVLRLLRWCRFISPLSLALVFTDAELYNLIGADLVKKHMGSGALMLTGKGHHLLDDTLAGHVPAYVQPSYRAADIERRLCISRLILTAYRAGIDVFKTDARELVSKPSLFMPALTRGRGSNPWANTRIAAIAHLGDAAFAFHYVAPGIGKLLPADELMAFTNNTTALGEVSRAFVFFGESYTDILTELTRPAEDETGRLLSYGEAWRRLSIPAHLLTCDALGAKQLQIMSAPNYRTRLAKAALRYNYRPASKDFPMCDALYKGAPLLIAVDMELRRVDAAIDAAKKRDCPPVVLVALKEQAEAILYARYRDTDMARVFTLTDAALTEAMEKQLMPYTPPQTQYLTTEGAVIHAPLIQAHRKAGGSRR